MKIINDQTRMIKKLSRRIVKNIEDIESEYSFKDGFIDHAKENLKWISFYLNQLEQTITAQETDDKLRREINNK